MSEHIILYRDEDGRLELVRTAAGLVREFKNLDEAVYQAQRQFHDRLEVMWQIVSLDDLDL